MSLYTAANRIMRMADDINSMANGDGGVKGEDTDVMDNGDDTDVMVTIQM